MLVSLEYIDRFDLRVLIKSGQGSLTAFSSLSHHASGFGFIIVLVHLIPSDGSGIMTKSKSAQG